MPVKKTREQFIADAQLKHGDRYSYKDVDYKGSTNKVSIICNIHGAFLQTAKDHLKGAGCPACAKDKALVTKRSTAEEFVSKAMKVHGDRYDYSEVVYTNSKHPVSIICSIHGMFTQTPNVHLKGCQCPMCAATQKMLDSRMGQEEFIDRATVAHEGVYSYDKTVYVKSSAKVTITCPVHGDFKQEANAHLQGRGCPKCGALRIAEARGEVCSGWSYSRWEDLADKSKDFDSFKVYILRCWDESGEEFIKIGKTYRTVGKRYRNCHIPYQWVLVKEIVGDALYISELEHTLQSVLREQGLKYKPANEFYGMQECFKIDGLKELDEYIGK